jgi:hypothetical protein
MPYIGNQPAANFASVTKDTFNGGDTSGASSVSVYTLSKAATTNGVAVFVENVRQEPTTAYSVSGTTLTFTGTTPSGTNNVYVLHHNAVASTANHPASQDLTAVAGTFTSDVTIGSGSAADRKILFDGNAQDYHIGLDDSADTLNIGKGSALGTTTAMTFDANGLILKPLQCMFDVSATASQSLSSASITKITFDTENADINSDFDLSNNKFIAPVAGKYLFQAYLTFSTMVAGAGIGLLWYKEGSVYRTGYHQSTEINITHSLSSTVIFNLAALDEIEIYAFQGGGSTETIGDANNVGSVSADNSNYWSGFLLG